MRVLQINAIYGEKSTGLIVKDLYDLLGENQIDAYIAYRDGVSVPQNSFEMYSLIGSAHHAIMTRVNGKQGYYSTRKTKKLIKYIEEKEIDIIHLHNLHSNFINLPLLLKYCAKANKSVVLTLHDCWFFTGKCFHFADVGCDRYTEGCHNCPKRRLDIPSYVVDSSMKVWQDRVNLFSSIKNLTVVGCSMWMCENANRFKGFSNARICQIYNGVDTEIFKPYKIEKKRGTFVLLGMANKWFLQENSEIVDAVISSLHEDERLILVGCTDEQIQGLSTEKKVEALGYVKDRYELAKIYSSADAFINLSLIDTLPTVNMESICCGTPVIAYDVGGGPELIDAGETGYIIPMFDKDSLLSAIDNVRKKKIIKEKCAFRGKVRFDKRKNYQKYIELYKKIYHGEKLL